MEINGFDTPPLLPNVASPYYSPKWKLEWKWVCVAKGIGGQVCGIGGDSGGTVGGHWEDRGGQGNKWVGQEGQGSRWTSEVTGVDTLIVLPQLCRDSMLQK